MRILSNYSRMFVSLLASALTLSTCFATDAQKPQIWLSGVDPFVRKAMKDTGPSDYDTLFETDAPWHIAASHVRVFKTSTQWILNGPDESLVRMFADLRRRGIALAVEGLMLTGGNNDSCGRGVEGYSSSGTIRHAAERIRSLGGKLSFIAMDEPLWFGHSYTGPLACQSSLQDLAQNVAENVRQVKDIFPDIQVGDIEPIPQLGQKNWVNKIIQWTAEFETAVGMPLAFFHADLNWIQDWNEDLSLLARDLGARGIKFGVIYDGNPGDPTDQAWTKTAEKHFDEVEGRLGIVPDHAILQTWMVHPTRMLPEDSPGTMTNLVQRYARTRTSMKLQQSDGQLIGTLADTEGHMISNAAISIMVMEDGRTGSLTNQKASGRVPQTARSALIGLRLNAECNCSGSGEVGIGTIIYSDDGGGGAVRRLANRNAAPATISNSTRNAPVQFLANTDRSIIVNSQSFSVSPGHIYQLVVPMRATADAVGAGYISLIFLGADNKEIRRDQIAIRQGATQRAIVTTDQNGTFHYGEKDLLPSSIEVVFYADEKFRTAIARLR